MIRFYDVLDVGVYTFHSFIYAEDFGRIVLAHKVDILRFYGDNDVLHVHRALGSLQHCQNLLGMVYNQASTLMDGKLLDIFNHEWKYNSMFSHNPEGYENICKAQSCIFQLSNLDHRQNEAWNHDLGKDSFYCLSSSMDLAVESLVGYSEWQECLKEVVGHRQVDFWVFRSKVPDLTSSNRVILSLCRVSKVIRSFTCCIFVCSLGYPSVTKEVLEIFSVIQLVLEQMSTP